MLNSLSSSMANVLSSQRWHIVDLTCLKFNAIQFLQRQYDYSQLCRYINSTEVCQDYLTLKICVVCHPYHLLCKFNILKCAKLFLSIPKPAKKVSIWIHVTVWLWNNNFFGLNKRKKHIFWWAARSLCVQIITRKWITSWVLRGY